MGTVSAQLGARSGPQPGLAADQDPAGGDSLASTPRSSAAAEEQSRLEASVSLLTREREELVLRLRAMQENLRASDEANGRLQNLIVEMDQEMQRQGLMLHSTTTKSRILEASLVRGASVASGASDDLGALGFSASLSDSTAPPRGGRGLVGVGVAETDIDQDLEVAQLNSLDQPNQLDQPAPEALPWAVR